MGNFVFAGQTASWNTGPPVDHTYSTVVGYYIYIETSWPRAYGDKAWLISPNIQSILPQTTTCALRFFYHMYGDSVETLSVFARQYRNGSVGNPIWKKTGSQGSVWRRAYIPLNMNYNFHVSGPSGFLHLTFTFVGYFFHSFTLYKMFQVSSFFLSFVCFVCQE